MSVTCKKIQPPLLRGLHTPSQAEGVTHTITGRGSYTHHHRQRELHTPPQAEGVTHTTTGRGGYTHHHRQRELHTPSQAEGVTHTITGRGSYTHHHRQRELHTPPQAEGVTHTTTGRDTCSQSQDPLRHAPCGPPPRHVAGLKEQYRLLAQRGLTAAS